MSNESASHSESGDGKENASERSARAARNAREAGRRIGRILSSAIGTTIARVAVDLLLDGDGGDSLDGNDTGDDDNTSNNEDGR